MDFNFNKEDFTIDSVNDFFYSQWALYHFADKVLHK